MSCHSGINNHLTWVCALGHISQTYRHEFEMCLRLLWFRVHSQALCTGETLFGQDIQLHRFGISFREYSHGMHNVFNVTYRRYATRLCVCVDRIRIHSPHCMHKGLRLHVYMDVGFVIVAGHTTYGMSNTVPESLPIHVCMPILRAVERVFADVVYTRASSPYGHVHTGRPFPESQIRTHISSKMIKTTTSHMAVNTKSIWI